MGRTRDRQDLRPMGQAVSLGPPPKDPALIRFGAELFRSVDATEYTIRHAWGKLAQPGRAGETYGSPGRAYRFPTRAEAEAWIAKFGKGGDAVEARPTVRRVRVRWF